MTHHQTLRGITWNHTRGYLPLVALSQWYEDLQLKGQVIWEKRSLKDFGDFPIEQLATRFDLLVIDHPFVGYAAANDTLLPLENVLPPEYLRHQAQGSVGRSFESYWFDGHLWALPIDAAAPVSCWRPDRLDSPPAHWEEVCELAERGLVLVPATPVDSLMNFYMFCCGLGQEPFASERCLVDPDIGAAALHYLKKLVEKCPPECLQSNPIAIYRKMALESGSVYCPFAFSYSNYARGAQYAGHISGGLEVHPLQFGNLVKLPGGARLRSTLGGTGLAISRQCRNADIALAFLQATAHPSCQRGIYVAAGGQPGHRSAWEDEAVNAAANGFFRNTLQTMDDAYLRPRYNGYLDFQEQGGEIVHQYLRTGGNTRPVLEKLEGARRASLEKSYPPH